jgi:hypothetical protein
MCLLRGWSQPDWGRQERLTSALDSLETRSFGRRVFISPLRSSDLPLCLNLVLLHTTYIFRMLSSVSF